MAHVDQPLRGSDDFVCSRASRHVSDHAPGPSLAGLLAVSLSKHDGHLAAVSQSLDVGRVCGVHLRHRLGNVLVRRSHSRLRNLARSFTPQAISSSVWTIGDVRARLRTTLASLRDGLLLLAGLATPLVLSEHTIVSFDFAVGVIP